MASFTNTFYTIFDIGVTQNSLLCYGYSVLHAQVPITMF